MPQYAQVDESVSPPLISVPREYNASAEFVDRNLESGVGDKTALIDDAGTYSYVDLAERINRAGNALASLGAGQETRVMLCLLDGVDFPAAFFGALRIGAVAIPVNTLLTSANYDYMLRDSRARILIVSEALMDKFEPVLEAQPYLESVVVSGGDGGAHSNFDSLCADASTTLEVAPTLADDVAFWLYTSGSTGRPKGSMHLHGDMVVTAALYAKPVLDINRDDVVFSAAKYFFAYGLGNSLTFPMYVGATTVVMAGRPTPDAVMSVLNQHQPSLYFGVPTLYGAILADEANNRDRGSSKLRLCVSAGEALPENLGTAWQQRFGTEILDGLGSTEMLHIFLSNRADAVRYGTTGKPIPGYALKLLDEDGDRVETGQIGELWVNGASAAIGYWNQRAKSLDTFHGPWTRTGDKYIVDQDGYYVYCGRTDDMLKVSGQWVSPFEVESALIAHQAVLEAGVVGREDSDGLIKPNAYLVLKDPSQGGDGLAGELKSFVKDRLAPFKYPRWIEFVDVLPKTATGKIQRFKLRDSSHQDLVP